MRTKVAELLFRQHGFRSGTGIRELYDANITDLDPLAVYPYDKHIGRMAFFGDPDAKALESRWLQCR